MKRSCFPGAFLLVMIFLLAPSLTSAQTTPAWKPGVDYSIGEMVSFNGATYKCIQDHTSDNSHQPPDVPALWQPLTNGTNCTAVPDAPTGLSAYSTTSSTITLSWKPSTVAANCVVTGYTVYQNGVSIALVASTTFVVRHLAPVVQYTFTIAAIDSAGASALSSPAPITTKAANPCTKLPGVPTELTASAITNTGAVLSWTVPAVDSGCNVPGYAVYKNGAALGTATGTHFTVTGLSASTTYTFTVAATDSAGNSGQSSPVSVTTKSGP